MIEIYRAEDVIGTLYRQGERLARGVRQAVVSTSASRTAFTLAGRPCALLYGTRDAEGKPSQQFRTLFLQELIKRGVLAPSFIVSYSHTDADIDRTIDAVAGALEVYRRALDEGVERVPGRSDRQAGLSAFQLMPWRSTSNRQRAGWRRPRPRTSASASAAASLAPVVVLSGGVTALGVMRAFGRRGIPTFVHPDTREYIRYSRWYRPLLPQGRGVRQRASRACRCCSDVLERSGLAARLPLCLQ